MKRMTTIHVEQEDDKWQYAANLILEIESVSEHLLASGLLNSNDIEISEGNTEEFHAFMTSLQSEEEEELHEQQQVLLATTASSSTGKGHKGGKGHATTHLTERKRHQLRNMLRSDAFLTTAKKSLTGILEWSFISSHSDTYETTSYQYQSGAPLYSFTCVQYLVSENFFSIHIPLHRFFVKLIYFACNGNITSIQELMTFVKTNYNDKEKMIFIDYPIRCLVFYTQVMQGLWKRNGLAAGNLAYNYNRIPLSKTLHNMDLLAIQFGSCILSYENLLFLLLTRFEIDYFLFQPNLRTIPKEKIHIISDFLRLLCHVVTYLPVILFHDESKTGSSDSDKMEGVRLSLKREIFHQILIGNASVTSLMKFKKVVGTNNTVSEQLLREVMHELCMRRNQPPQQHSSNGSSPAGNVEGDDFLNENYNASAVNMILKEESYRFYDPEFYNFNDKQIVQAMDKMKEKYKQQINEANNNTGPSVTSSLSKETLYRKEKIAFNPRKYHENPYFPIIFLSAIPLEHPDFRQVKGLLYSKLFVEILLRIMTLLCLSTNANYNFNRITVLGRIIQLLTIQIYFQDDFPHDFQHLYYKDNIGFQLIVSLLEVWKKELLKEEFFYQEGLLFLFYEMNKVNPDLKELFEQNNCILSVEEEHNESGKLSKTSDDQKSSSKSQSAASKNKDQLRKAAQERLLNETKLKAQNAMKLFADMMDSDEESEEDESQQEMEVDALGSKKKTKKLISQPVETCIICKEKKNTPLAYLCYIQPSNTLQQMISHYQFQQQSDSTFAALKNVYRVVSRSGCSIYSTTKVSSTNFISVVPYNEHVLTTGERKGAWIQIITPVKGFALIHQWKGPQEIDNSINTTHHFSKNYLVILQPVTSYLFNKNGGTRLYCESANYSC
jgi:hypothetical protein